MPQTHLHTAEFVREARLAFFQLMLSGYADPDRKPEKTGRFADDTSLKRFVWPVNGQPGKAGWLAIDEWTTSPDRHGSFGNTILYHDSVPVWHMTYSSHYPDEVIPFLKKALFYTYQAHEWCGGRGPQEFGGNGMIYQNNWTGSFVGFRSEEFIAQKFGSLFEKTGGHICVGGFL